MEFLVEAIVWLFVEVLLPTVLEGLLDRLLLSASTRPIHPVRAAVGYVIVGAALGALSTTYLREPVIDTPWLRAASLVAAPVVVGAAAALLAHVRGSRRASPPRHAFWFGLALAAAFAIARVVVVRATW